MDDGSIWAWLMRSNAGLAVRIGAGVLIFALLAVLDLRRRGREATRWREYLFLLLCVVSAMLYGIANDMVTSTISWEYFCFAKEQYPQPITVLPPVARELYPAAAIVGMKATWTAGLLIGAILLIANNPRRSRPRLPYTKMNRHLAMIFAITVLCAACFGFAGYAGAFDGFDGGFAEAVTDSPERRQRFLTVWSIHIGAYAGGAIGMIVAAVLIFRRKIDVVDRVGTETTRSAGLP
jgi:hypothetical protein